MNILKVRETAKKIQVLTVDGGPRSCRAARNESSTLQYVAAATTFSTTNATGKVSGACERYAWLVRGSTAIDRTAESNRSDVDSRFWVKQFRVCVNENFIIIQPR